MHCRLLIQYAIIMVQLLAGLQKVKLRPGPDLYKSYAFSIIIQGFKKGELCLF